MTTSGKGHDAEPTPAGTRYTCPMHPEIVRTQPGSCPICGMALEPLMPSLDDGENPELTDFRRRFWWTLPLSLAVLAIAMLGHRWQGFPPQTRTWLELALSAPVVLWAGWPFFARWVQSIGNRSPNMWTLIGTGVGAAFGYSVVATIVPDAFPASFHEHGRVGVYFEAAAIIVSLTLLGQLLELKARSNTSAAIKALLGLAPRTARRLRDDGSEEDVPLTHVHPGDRLGAVVDLRSAQFDRCADHRLSLCSRAGNADVDHGGDRSRGTVGCSVSRCGGDRAATNDRHADHRQDRHVDAGQAGFSRGGDESGLAAR